jgi:peptidoglycan/xylan/chitin deacetylase (PgdA/CDA1 family)
MIGKRELLAQLGHKLGLGWLIGLWPTLPLLISINYHRIGDASAAAYDSDLFSATQDQFDEQMAFLQKRFDIVTLEEAIAIVDGAAPLGRCCILVTFDDGYRDNYELAFPVLRARRVPAVFFLPTSFVGTSRLPWWDEIAYLIKQSRRRDREAAASTAEAIRMYKELRPSEADVFLDQLAETSGVNRLRQAPARLFLNWDEAAEMLRAGMAIGSHAHSHNILSRLSEQDQFNELMESRRILEERLGHTVTSLAYPVGTADAFNAASREAARQAGYRIAFSYFGGFNRPGACDRFNICRVGIGPSSRARFEMQTALAAVTGSFWL